VGAKADRSDVLTTVGALQTMLLSKMDRAEAEQLLARKLDIRTFLASQSDAPAKSLGNSGARLQDSDAHTPQAAPVSGPHPTIGIETASAADLLRTGALRTAGTRQTVTPADRSCGQNTRQEEWGLSRPSGGGSDMQVSGFGAQAVPAGRLSSVRICSDIFMWHSIAI
jgi:hypothetical protein